MRATPAAAEQIPAAVPVAAAPAPAPSPAAEITPAPEAAAPAEPAAPSATTSAEETNSALLWAPIVIGGLIILGLLGYLFSRRRRTDETVYEEETYYAPVEEAPAAAAPAAFVAEPVAAAVPVAAAGETSRPWIDIGLRPIRAENDAVQVELTVSNSGEAEAHDVRVSTWMLGGAQTTEGEQALIEARSGAQVATVDVAPGEDESVDTRVALPSEAGTPILVAEARYPLPHGGEGRIAATFEIDVTQNEVEARLHELLERA